MQEVLDLCVGSTRSALPPPAHEADDLKERALEAMEVGLSASYIVYRDGVLCYTERLGIPN